MKKIILVLAVFVLLLTAASCSGNTVCEPGDTAQTASQENAPEEESTIPAKHQNTRGYPDEIWEIWDNDDYNAYDKGTEILALIEEKQTQCAELRDVILNGVDRLFDSEYMDNWAERRDPGKAEFIQYYNDKIEFIEKENEFYHTVYFWNFTTGTGQTLENVIHEYTLWKDFYDELVYINHLLPIDYSGDTVPGSTDH